MFGKEGSQMQGGMGSCQLCQFVSEPWAQLGGHVSFLGDQNVFGRLRSMWTPRNGRTAQPPRSWERGVESVRCSVLSTRLRLGNLFFSPARVSFAPRGMARKLPFWRMLARERRKMKGGEDHWASWRTGGGSPLHPPPGGARGFFSGRSTSESIFYAKNGTPSGH